MPRWSGRRARALLVAPVTAVLLLAGCTGGVPVVEESSTPREQDGIPTVEPSDVGVPLAPRAPLALTEPPSVSGAVDVATYFVELYPYLFATGDTTQWEQLSAPDCVFCSDVIEDADALAAQGHQRVGGTVSIGYSVGAEIGDASSYSVDLTMEEAPARVVDSDGTEVDAWSAAQKYRTSVVLLHDGASWSIRAVEPIPVTP